MVRQHVDPSVTAAKECAQEPAHEGDNDRAKNRAPEAVDLETRHNLAHELQHQRVDDQNEEAERYQNQRNTQEQQNRANKSVDDSKKKRRAQQTANSGVIDSHDRRCYKHGKRRDEPTKNEMPHGATLLEFNVLAKQQLQRVRRHLPAAAESACQSNVSR